jgi:hypothetical protein
LFFLFFLVCDVSVSLSRYLTVRLHSQTPHGTSLTSIPPSINHQSATILTYLLPYRYGEFLGDCRLTFQNSIKYNGVHLADEGSAVVHKAAVGFLQKLEELLPSWTIEAAEKCQRDSISASAAEKRQRETYARLLEEKEKMEEFAHQELQRRLAEDAAFREDMDVEKKKQRTYSVLCSSFFSSS